MPVVFLIAIAMVLVGIFFAATGRGGELAYEHADHAPLDLGPVSAADIALLRPPTAMWGYNMQVTDAALDQIARAMRERDVTIAYLQEQVATYERNGSYAESRGVHARQAPGTLEPDALDTPGVLGTSGFPEASGSPTNPDLLDPRAAFDPPESSAAFDPPESSAALDPPEPSEAFQSPEPYAPQDTPDALEPLDSPEPFAAAEPPAAAATTQAPEPPRTALVLKASGPKPDPHEATQPSQTLQDPGEPEDATEPTEVLPVDEESREATQPAMARPAVTQPAATTAPDDPPGPQGAFDTHGWWAEQQQAARAERERRRAAGEQDDDSVAAAEEQGW